MNLLETFSTLDEIYDSYIENNNSLIEGQSMPYALLVKSGNTWSVYKGLHSEPTTEEELAKLDMFLKDKPEYSEVKVIPSSDIYKYVKKTNENLKEHYLSRDEIISKLKALGRQYHFNKYTDEQLYCILEKEEKKAQDKLEAEQAQSELIKQQLEKEAKPACDECGCTLTDGGYCPVCDNGEEDLFEGIFDGPSNLNSWVVMPSTNTTPQQTTNISDAQNTGTNNANSAGGYIVTIMYDGHKLRARADDGVHGRANVAFPTALRNHNGQQYEVENLVWNGKNYRASGKIKPVNSVANTQNINENINKENPEMNFTSVMEELNRLYEEDTNAKKIPNEADEESVDEGIIGSLAGAAVGNAVGRVIGNALTEDEEVTNDEVEESTVEYDQLILECSKCGALTIKDKDAIATNEDTDLVNEEDACAFCEETAGYKIIGAVAPYVTETDEVVEDETDETDIKESLLTEGKIKDSLKKLATRLGADGATVVRAFGEAISELLPEKAGDVLYYAVTDFENRAVLKALMNGNEKVLNTLTVDDIEELKQDIENYKKRKAEKKSENSGNKNGDKKYWIISRVKGAIKWYQHPGPSGQQPYNSEKQAQQVANDMLSKSGRYATDTTIPWSEFRVVEDGSDMQTKAIKKLSEYVDYMHDADLVEALEDVDKVEDTDLDELFNTKINVDARGFGGSGNDVDII